MVHVLLAAFSVAVAAPASTRAAQPGYSPEECPYCASWNTPRPPSRLFANTYWVGTQGLGAILITSDSGHVLIDGGLPESASLIVENVQALGLRVEDIEVILNSHAHFDHAGGIAELQRRSGALVQATHASSMVLRSGRLTPEDPQRDAALAFPPVSEVALIGDGDTVRVGRLELVAHVTPGHSPGGTTWSWRACEGVRCLDVVYADSQTPVSDDSFRFSEGDRAEKFERGLRIIEALSCDILLTPHPGASNLWERVEDRESGNPDALVDPAGCARYAAMYREQLARRMDREAAGP